MNADANKKKSGKIVRITLWLGVVAALVVLILVASLWIYLEKFGFPSQEETPASELQTQDPSQITIHAVEALALDLGNDLQIQDVGKYAGIYMEDGSDEIVTDVLMAVVSNHSESDVQLLNFTLSNGEKTASFSLTNLAAGASVVVLESSRMAYTTGFDQAEVQNLALFSQPMSLCSQQLEISTVGSALNITNISGEDMTGDIVLYYKNSAADMLYGGITYRVRIQGGLKAGELRQIMPNHYHADSSTIVNITCG